jgi:hypothetical protein
MSNFAPLAISFHSVKQFRLKRCDLKRGALLLLTLLFTNPTIAQLRFQSGPQAVSVIELYTSEGCYSCPPADRWLSELKDHHGLFSEFVPLSFHVDYWNYLGWQDTYSREEFSDRQRRYHRLGQVSGVYTPGMFLDGYEWRLWRGRESVQFDKKTKNNVGILSLDLNNDYAELEFAATNDQSIPGKAYIAILGADIEAPIPAGENKGKTLRHDFVVLELRESTLRKNAVGNFVASVEKLRSELTAPRYALAAWVTNEKDNKPLQATGGWLP